MDTTILVFYHFIFSLGDAFGDNAANAFSMARIQAFCCGFLALNV